MHLTLLCADGREPFGSVRLRFHCGKVTPPSSQGSTAHHRPNNDRRYRLRRYINNGIPKRAITVSHDTGWNVRHHYSIFVGRNS